MITKLSWKTKFRVAVLIRDAPGHERNFNTECGHITATINKLII